VRVISGEEASHFFCEILKEEIRECGIEPHMGIIMVGDNPASKVYVRNKMRRAESIGIRTTLVNLPVTATFHDVASTIKNFNNDERIDGFIVQMPLPEHLEIYRENLIELIEPDKDVDGFTPVNLGRLVRGVDFVAPATPLGILFLLLYHRINVEGKRVCVIGRSTTVGLPLSILLAHKGFYGNATVCICHSHTRNLRDITLQSDIVVCAVGKPNLLDGSHVRDGSIIIDVGINVVNGKIRGDVNVETLKDRDVVITPVPGGVGPMTVFGVLFNTVSTAMKRKGLKQDKGHESFQSRIQQILKKMENKKVAST